MHQIGPKMHTIRQRRGRRARKAAFAMLLASGWSGAAMAQDHQHMPGMQMPGTPSEQAPAPATPSAPQPEQSHAGHGAMPGMDMAAGDHMMMDMPAAFGPYPMTREASGTAWQPDASPMAGMQANAGRLDVHGPGHAQRRL